MARFVHERNINVYWLVTLATTSTPLVSEISSGVNLTNFVSKDGVKTGISGNNVDSATIAENFNAQVVGSVGADLQLIMFRDDATDTAWNTCVYGSNGYLVIDRFRVSGTLPTSGSKVEVWPAEMHFPAPEDTGQDTVVRFVEMFAVTSQPYLSAVVRT